MANDKSRSRLRQILLLAVLFYVVLTAAYLGYEIHAEKSELYSELDHELHNAARTIPLVLEPGFFDRASQLGGISEQEDLRNITNLTRLAESLNLSYLYTLTEVDGTVYVTSSSASEEERENGTEVRAFTAYPEMAEHARAAMASGTPHTCDHVDRWGTFRHVYVPRTTSKGNRYLLAADQRADVIISMAKKEILEKISVPLFFILAAIPFLFAYRTALKKSMRDIVLLNQRLRENEERCDLAAEAGGIGIWDYDIMHDRLIWDKRMYKIYGIPEEGREGVLDLWKRHVHPSDVKRALESMDAAIHEAEPFDVEFRIIRPDGSIRHIRAYAKVTRNSQGQAERMIGINMDITEHKETEDLVREALSRIRRITGQVPGMIYQYCQRPDGSSCLPYASDKIRDIFRVSPEQVKNDASDAFAVIHPDDHAGVVESIHASAQNLTPWVHDYRLKFDDGTVRWISGKAVPQKEPDGSVLWYGFIYDVTEQKETQQKLQESEVKLRHIVENSTNMFYTHTPDHVLTYVSPQVKNILGYEVEEALTRWTELASDHPVNERALETTEKAIRTGEAQPTYALQLLHKEGHPVWVEVNEAPLVENGKTTAIVGSLTNVTERINAEQRIKESKELLQSTIDGLSAHIALIDEDGTILLVNRAWRRFAEQNDGIAGNCCEGSNYLKTCDGAGGSCSEEAADVAKGLRGVLHGSLDTLSLEYPCNSETEERWFIVNVCRVDYGGHHHAVVFHTNITEAKRAETALKQKMDELERFNKAAVGRELRMIELKEEINALCREQNREEPYGQKI